MTGTVFPGALDDFTNPAALDTMNGTTGGPEVVHHLQHSQVNDAIEAIEAAIGITGSTVPTSIIYKLAALAAAVMSLEGTSLLYGSGAPSSGTGVDGNFYLDQTAHVLYGPKAAGAWPSGTSLVGPAGATGPTGP